MNCKRFGFTLIELLIVVAIIAILAAIAVPNFLEAQTRAKVSRAAADMRSIRVGIESYRVDQNNYPETDTGYVNLPYGMGLYRTTTPVAYITSVPGSPFKEEKMGNPGPGSEKFCNLFKFYLYVRARKVEASEPVTDTSPADGLDDNYNKDRFMYLANGDSAINLGLRSQGEWELKSVGPNNEDDFHIIGLNARAYDPTNGTISEGDLTVFSDTVKSGQR